MIMDKIVGQSGVLSWSLLKGRPEEYSEDSKLRSTERPSSGLRGAGVEEIGVLEARISG